MSSVENAVARQKWVADLILSRLEVIDPACIVAGGAPRDWYMGVVASDIDVFLHTRQDLTTRIKANQLCKALDIEESELRRLGLDVMSENYNHNPSLARVWELTLFEQKIQVMEMRDPTYNSVVPKFPFNVCKVWYKGGRIVADPEFYYGIENKCLVKTGEVYSDSDRYVQKIKDKFKDFKYFEDEKEFTKHVYRRAMNVNKYCRRCGWQI